VPKLPVISGLELAKMHIEQRKYIVRSRKGSHINLVHDTLPPVTVPAHRELRPGLLHHILKVSGLELKK